MKTQTTRIALICLLAATLFQCTPSPKTITFGTLITDMTNPRLLSEYPDPGFICKQFSSYDRRTITPDQDGWFANADASWFVREETNSGRREFVMMDAAGPGAVVRFWMTFGNEQAYTGTLRIYLDGNTIPEIEGPVLKIISGGQLVGEPLSSSVSPLTVYAQRGHNLYMPIPYSKQIKITYECPALNPEKHSPSVYYNINYRTYDAGTSVKSFSLEDLKTNAIQISELQNRLLKSLHQSPDSPEMEQHKMDGTAAIDPGKNISLELKGTRAIYALTVRIKADNLPQALRSTVLCITFDREKTVWSPLGDFFGTGYQIRPYQTWYTQVDSTGLMKAYWVMPFRKTAVIELINYGDQKVTAEIADVSTGKYKWTGNTMHFGAIWHEYNGIDTKGYLGDHIKGKHEDINFVKLEGQGQYAGDAITIFNTADAWWGEGDEKVYVDGEKLPSHIGTGTEDYIGYAWCRPEFFNHFLIAQPDGSGNFHTGMTVNMRRRMLDAVPFTQKLNFDMELWHWATTKMNYAVVSYWYMKPGGKCLVEPDPAIVKIPVSLKRENLYPPVADLAGMLQGEHLRVISLSAGAWEVQNSSEWGWSNNAQLWWMDGGPKGLLKAEFEMAQEGDYTITGNFTKAIDYGDFKMMINDQPVEMVFKGYHNQAGKPVITELVRLGKFHLKQGINTLQIEIIGKQPKAVGRYMVGIDCLKIRNDE
ncbi:MAG: glycoside hydrolase family 172 protein [Bacteroidales bacterium]